MSKNKLFSVFLVMGLSSLVGAQTPQTLPPPTLGAPWGYVPLPSGYMGGGFFAPNLGGMVAQLPLFVEKGLVVYPEGPVMNTPSIWLPPAKGKPEVYNQIKDPNGNPMDGVTNVVSITRDSKNKVLTYDFYNNVDLKLDGVPNGAISAAESWNSAKGYYVVCSSYANTHDKLNNKTCDTITPAFCKELQRMSGDMQNNFGVTASQCVQAEKEIAKNLNVNNKNLDLDNIKKDFADFENKANPTFRNVSNTTLDMVTNNSGERPSEMNDLKDFDRILQECRVNPDVQVLKNGPFFKALAGSGMVPASFPQPFIGR